MTSSMTTTTPRKIGVAAVMIVASALVLSACSGGGSTGASGSASDKTVGVVSYDTTVVSAAAEATAVVAAVKAEGWTAISQDSKGDAAQANATCTQYVTRQVSAIVVSVFNTDQMAQCLTGAKAAGVPVFFLAGALGDGVAGAISTTLASTINDVLIKDLKTFKNPKILALETQAGAPCVERQKDLEKKLADAGLSDILEGHEVVIPGQVLDAQSTTAAWLSKNPAGADQSPIIWSCFSDPAVGAAAAIKQAGRTDLHVYLWDLTKQNVDYIKDGTFTATLAIDSAKEGSQMVEMIKKYLDTKKPELVDAGYTILTKDNVEKFLTDNPNAAN